MTRDPLVQTNGVHGKQRESLPNSHFFTAAVYKCAFSMHLRPQIYNNEEQFMGVNTPSANVQGSGSRIVAFFQKKRDDYRAVSELREAGFTSEEIGLMTRSDRDPNTEFGNTGRDRSLWDKLKDFSQGRHRTKSSIGIPRRE